MSRNKEIEKLLSNFTDDKNNNLRIVLEYINKNNMTYGSFIHEITSKVYDENKASEAISLLLHEDSSQINSVNERGCNIVQNAISSNYSDGFITRLLLICSGLTLKNTINLKHVDADGNTILHNMIYADEFKTNIAEMVVFLYKLGFDFSVLDKSGRNIIEAMKYEKSVTDKFSDKEIDDVALVFEQIKKQKDKKTGAKDSKKEVYFADRIKYLLNNLEGTEFDYYLIKSFCKKELVNEEDLLYSLSSYSFDEKSCFAAIKCLINKGYDINYVPEKGMNSIFQNLVENGYSKKFVIVLVDYIYKTQKINVNLNYKNKDGETIAFSAIKSGVYGDDEVLGFIYELKKYGYDVNVRDGQGREIFDAINYYKYGGRDIYSVPKESNAKKSKNNVGDENLKSKKMIEELEKCGKVLNYKNFVVEPVIGREKELKNLIVTLAQDKKNPIIVGESGVGKTALVEQLAYKISKGEVPKFLQNKIVLEVNPSELVAGCKYVGQFEEKMKQVFDLVVKYDVALFIDEIHTIYGVGASEKKSTGLESMIKNFIDRNNIKIIGTTTEEEYEQYFAHDALKRRFEKIKVEEPVGNVLYKIIDKVLDDYCIKNSVSFKDDEIKRKIIGAIMFATEKNHRVYNDRINNPDLAISIIDKAFGFAKYNESEYIGEDCFIESFDYCDRIYDSISKEAINMLKKDMLKKEDKKCKILTVDFAKKR